MTIGSPTTGLLTTGLGDFALLEGGEGGISTKPSGSNESGSLISSVSERTSGVSSLGSSSWDSRWSGP